MEDKNYNEIILNCYKKVQEFDQIINNKLLNFVTNCIVFEKTSNHKYEIQKNIKLNKIYLQGYVLDFPVCKYLKEKYKHNYSINELHEFINLYEKESGSDFVSYHDALNLFEDANKLEELVDNKIEYEINVVKGFTNKILSIDSIEKSKYQVLFDDIENTIINYYFKSSLINGDCLKLIIMIVNDIFKYFSSGNIEIPKEYINHE